jgi:maleate isomerase
MAEGFGSKARIGQLYPSGGLVDYEPQLMAPEGVQFLTTRMTFRKTGLADDEAMIGDLEFHAGLLADAQVDLIAFNCTAASLVAGPGAINARIRAATGLPSVTTIEAVIAALDAAGLSRLALMTPYPPEVVAAETAFFTQRGFSVVAEASQPCDDPVAQGTIPPQAWRELAQGLTASPADGLLISCAGIRLAPVLAAIEADFGRPVIASNPALLWHCLRQLAVQERPKGFGQLLEGRFDHPEAAPYAIAAPSKVVAPGSRL